MAMKIVAIVCRLIFLFLFVVFLLFLVRIVLVKTGLIYTVKKWRRRIEDCFHVYQFFKIPEFNENLQENLLYRRVYVYLNSLTAIEESDFTNLFTGKESNEIVLRLDRNQVVEDDFLGARVSWINGEDEDGMRSFKLKIRKADKRRILRPYLQHIHSESEELVQSKKELKLYMIAGKTDRDRKKNGRWRSVPFTHPCTFDTIAMEETLKKKVKSDLESFLNAKLYYHRLGRVWKRSFLLYGPSGTGKSSFVAAMANFLGYNVYDLDIWNVADDSDLKMLLLQTTSRSLIVIEDLDLFLKEKSTDVSLSGILNFMDGIISSCAADERIIVFTMNRKDSIDPEFLRPGRIDVHIHFPFCDFAAFKTLADSHLGIKDHKLFLQVKEIFQDGGAASLSPAEITELMIANRNSPSRAIKSVISAMQLAHHDRRLENAAVGRISAVEDFDGRLSSGGSSSPAAKDFRRLLGLLRSKGNRTS